MVVDLQWRAERHARVLHNCADFATAVWWTATHNRDAVRDAVFDGGDLIWTPGDVGAVIDAANRAKGLDLMGNPLPQSQAWLGHPRQ